MKMTFKGLIYLCVNLIYLVSCNSVEYETHQQTGYGMLDISISYEYPVDATWDRAAGVIDLKNGDPVEFRSLDLEYYEDLLGLQFNRDDLESIMKFWIPLRAYSCQGLIETKSLQTKYGLKGEMAVSSCEGSDVIFIAALLTDGENIISIGSFSNQSDYKGTQSVFEHMADSVQIITREIVVVHQTSLL